MTFLERLIRSAEHMDYYGIVQIKKNNMMAVSALGWHRGITAGFYQVFADECRGVFIPHHTSMLFGFYVFPGV